MRYLSEDSPLTPHVNAIRCLTLPVGLVQELTVLGIPQEDLNQCFGSGAHGHMERGIAPRVGGGDLGTALDQEGRYVDVAHLDGTE